MSENEGRENIEAVEKIDITMIIKDIFRVLKKMWKQCIVLIISMLILSVVVANKRYVPYYTASATYAINIAEDMTQGISSNQSFFNNSAAEQMAETFPYILTSGVLQRKVARDLNVPAISGNLSATVTPNTNFLVIAVRDVNPESAYNTLQSVVKNYPSVSELIIGKINMELLDETGIPKFQDNPKNLKISAVKGILAGIVISIIWIFLVAFLRRTIRREEDCARYFNARCLGSIPRIRHKVRSRNNIQQLNIMDENMDPSFVEAFQILTNKVEYSVEKNHTKSILITSALAGEGKSTIAVNLALNLAFEGKKVILIDGDLRNPSDSQILSVDNKKGLVDYLTGKVELKECLIEGKDIFKSQIPFWFVPGGKAVPDGAELLESVRMKRLIEKWEEQVDYVIIDSAPVGLLTDATVLGEFVDNTIFVIKKDYAKVDYILEGMEQLTEDNIHMIGCILNNEN